MISSLASIIHLSFAITFFHGIFNTNFIDNINFSSLKVFLPSRGKMSKKFCEVIHSVTIQEGDKKIAINNRPLQDLGPNFKNGIIANS